MTWTADRATMVWFEGVLGSPSADVRRRAVEMLVLVDCAERPAWLSRLARDPDPTVVAAATVASAIVCATGAEQRELELFESEFAEALRPDPDMAWEWEYELRVCLPGEVSLASIRVWLPGEDDRAAREVALLKAGDRHCGAVAIVVGKRLVNTFTRRPRNRNEAIRWQRYGRPRYGEGQQI